MREQSNEQVTSIMHLRRVKSKSNKAILLKKDQHVNFKMAGDDTPREGVVLECAGKASSNTKNWYIASLECWISEVHCQQQKVQFVVE